MSTCVFAESHILYSSDVLSSLLQLASLILQVCSSAQRSLQAWFDANQPQHPIPNAAVAPGILHGSATAAQTLPQLQQQHLGNVKSALVDSNLAEVIDLTADTDNSHDSDGAAADPPQHAAHTQMHCIVEGANALLDSLQKAEALQGQLPEQVAGPRSPEQAAGVQLPIQATAPQQLSQHLPKLVPKQEATGATLLDQEALCKADSRPLPTQASLSHQSPRQLPKQAVEMGSEAVDECMLCAYGMDLAAVLGCLLEQIQDWPGVR